MIIIILGDFFMATWTANDVTRIREYLNLSYSYNERIQYALRDFESQYGATGIADVQAKLAELDALSVEVANITNSGDYGILSQSVPNYYSFSRRSGSEIEGRTQSILSAKQWIVRNLYLQDVANIGGYNVIRG